ncbi:hypothetical protein DY000_02022152, partial [Brassica cretica]
YIFFLDVRSGKLRRAQAKDDDWRLLSVHTQTGNAEGFANVSCFENLLGSPTFVDIRNGRLSCVETGHEVVAGDEEAYARNKRCRLGVIDHALFHRKSPLTMFWQCLISRSKLMCKLIGDTMNKNEEHIWKYVNGKRFLHRLDALRKKLTPMIQSFVCLNQVLFQSQSMRVMKKTAKVLIVMPKNMRSSQKVVLSLLHNKEDVNRNWTKYDHYGSATMGKLAERIYTVASKLTDNSLYHVCVFSDNIVATSVVVKYTALNSKAPKKVVFHLVTNGMKSWFAMNMDNLRGVTVDVQKFEDFKWLNAFYVRILKQLQDSDTQSYYFSGHNDDGRTEIKFRNPKYLSTLNHLNAQLYLFIRPYK